MRMVVPEPEAEVAPVAPPSFAIVIPAFNAAETVAVAVQSVLEQTVPAEEVIVVDDGSTDDLVAALAPYETQLTLVRQENRGAASARNAGVRTAQTDFVAFLDADDVYHPRRLEGLAALGAKRPDLDILTTDTVFVWNGQPRGRYHTTHRFPVTDQPSEILATCFTFGCPAVRRSRLLEIGGFDQDLRTGEDWDCMIRLILSGSRAGLVDEPLLEYHVRPGSLTSHRVSALWDRVRVLEKTARTHELDDGEAAALERSLNSNRARAALAEAEEGLRGDGMSLRRVVALVFQRGLTPKTRLQLATAGVAPPLARRWIPKDPGSLSRRLASAD